MGHTRLDPGARVLPSLFLLVFDNEIVAHNDQVSIVRSVLHASRHHIHETVQAGSAFTFRSLGRKVVGIFVEAEEAHRLYNLDRGVLDQFSVAIEVAEINFLDHTLSEVNVFLRHSGGHFGE